MTDALETERIDERHLVGDGWIAPRARFDTDAPLLPLNGEWALRISASPAAAPDDLAGDGPDTAGWDRIPVPSSWPMQGHGAPAYTNTRFPFPVDPPHVPDANPVGDHARSFTWEHEDTRALLRLDGVDAVGEVWLNGRWLGSTAGSRLVHEFDMSGVLVRGENRLVLRVTQWAATSYLEDQDMWWLPGVFRDVAVQAAPAGGLQDVRVHADLVDGRGCLLVEADVRDGAEAVVDVPALGLEGLPVGVAHEGLDVPAWTAETPDLVDVVVRTATERASLRVGFRTITIEDAQLKVNGRRIRIRGVNRHEHHPDLGRVVPPEVVRQELLLMKRHHVNAIRTSHYPPHPDLPALADELGFYLVDECDLETHGFVHVGWRRNPSDDPQWEPAYLDRMRRTVARDRNHASVILWSLGNEAGTGRNLEASARLAKELDPSRPVHYEGDWSSTYVDVYSRMYAHQDEVAAIGRQEEAPLPDPAADAHRRSLPFIQCEYVHAMGNGPGGMSEYETSFRTYPRTQGGFVWEWLEHGIRRRTADGREFFAYGGDFDEEIHDGNFVADGLVDADRNPRPGLLDYAKVIEPIELAVVDGRVQVTNRYDFVDLGAFELVWSRGDAHGFIGMPHVAPGTTAVVPLPAEAEGDGVLTVSAVTREESDWATDGQEVAWVQHGALAVPAPVKPSGAVHEEGGTIRLGPGAFDAATGRLTELGGLPVDGPTVALWRAPTDNDRGIADNKQEGLSDAERWALAGLDRLHARVVAVRVEDAALEVETVVAPAAADHRLRVVARWTTDGEALGLEVSLTPEGPWSSGWARAGLELALPWAPDDVAWDGYGPGQRYPDTGQSQRLGAFRVDGVRALHTDYVKPQENGSRSGVVRVALGREGRGFAVEGDGFAFTASPWTSAELDAAAHPTDLPEAADRARLVLDLAQHGIGTASCGPGVLPQHRLDARPVRGVLAFRPF
ncbi:glycoside hydrolase family 2 TIM barrel-domain containing protein [Amnibacterium setariae]|uniref:Beta-galactosidase n=1 Tax=Amnibacterium setariae TaxID=2306585 RepID=A0A3A1U906_9MICO|nr:glycoside hydrolase family 2 TIM barrel-domain containing protein [Amnibacterium setariae]RIX30729.1 DUF4981 domain-containing protein [Amnibacterium setariae]